ncbi:hypothetical protein ACF0H5_020398 [Mactra antiquata]
MSYKIQILCTGLSTYESCHSELLVVNVIYNVCVFEIWILISGLCFCDHRWLSTYFFGSMDAIYTQTFYTISENTHTSSFLDFQKVGNECFNTEDKQPSMTLAYVLRDCVTILIIF